MALYLRSCLQCLADIGLFATSDYMSDTPRIRNGIMNRKKTYSMMPASRRDSTVRHALYNVGAYLEIGRRLKGCAKKFIISC